MQALKEWRQYCEEAKHTVRMLTDHKNVVPFTTTKKLNCRQLRWNEELANFDINIEYGPRLEGEKPEALTRRSRDLPTPRDAKTTPLNITLLPRGKYWRTAIQLRTTETHQIKEKNSEELENASGEDTQFQEIRKALQMNQKGLQGVALGLCQWRDNLLWYNNRVWIPNEEKIRTEIIRQHHDIPQAGHGGTAKTTPERLCRT